MQKVKILARYFALICIVCFLPVAVYAEKEVDPDLELRLKAALILKIPAYVDYPKPLGDELKIGVLCECALSEALISSSGKIINGKKVQVINLADEKVSVSDLHLVFMHGEDSSVRDDALDRFKGLALLTVGSGDGFIQSGGMVSLYTLRERLRFDVNLKAMRAVNMKMRASMVRLARKVVR